MASLTPSIDIQAQGGLFRLHVARPDVKRVVVNAVRGRIYQFSRRSRKRLLELSARLDYSLSKAVFLTLTYPLICPNPATAKKHLYLMFDRLQYHAKSKGVSCIWRLEFQQRGAPHFHLMLFGLPFIDKALIQRMWCEVIGSDERVFTRIELIKSTRHARYYVSKYIAKASRPKSRFCSVREKPTGVKGAGVFRRGGFNTKPYLGKHSQHVDGNTGEIMDAHTGRWWGVLQKSAIPFAQSLSIEFADNWYRVLYNLKRYMRRVYRHTTKHTYRGGTLFCTNALRWYELVLFEVLRE